MDNGPALQLYIFTKRPFFWEGRVAPPPLAVYIDSEPPISELIPKTSNLNYV